MYLWNRFPVSRKYILLTDDGYWLVICSESRLSGQLAKLILDGLHPDQYVEDMLWINNKKKTANNKKQTKQKYYMKQKVSFNNQAGYKKTKQKQNIIKG